MKIGIVQFAPVLGDPAASIQRLTAILDHAPHVDLLILPELSNSGYNFTSREQAVASSEQIGEGPFSDFLFRMSRKLDCHVVGGLNERDGEFLYNSAILVDRNDILVKYQKMHLYLNEPDFFEQGETLPTTIGINGVHVSILICFDWAFPEVWRMAALAGAQVVCHPSNIVYPQRALRALAGHALCNRIFIVTANRTGTEGGLTFGGQSSVLAPSGEMLLQATVNENILKIVEIDPLDALDKMMTPRNHVINGRRPEMYTPVVNTEDDD